MLWIVTVVVVILVGLIGFVSWVKWQDDKKNEWDVMSFIKDHPDQSALYLICNDQVEISHQENKPMVLASTVKIIIAIEYSKQVADGTINKDELVPLGDLACYYIPNTDGGAHEAWLKTIEEEYKGKPNSASIQEVAKGMIHFSSNANTEYLLDLLGVNNINKNLYELQLTKHDDLYYFTSSFFIPIYLKLTESLSSKEIREQIKHMDPQTYQDYAYKVHQQLKQGKTNEFIENISLINNIEIQKATSNRLPKATVKDYAHLMNQINQDEILSEEILAILKDILGRYPKESMPFSELGFKGGSTDFVTTWAMYAIDDAGNHLSVAAFIDDQKRLDIMWVGEKLPQTIFKLLGDKSFADETVRKFESDTGSSVNLN